MLILLLEIIYLIEFTTADGDAFLTVMNTLLTETDMLIDALGLPREDIHNEGQWDIDRSFRGLTEVKVQIKFNDRANKWKGGRAHIEVQDLRKLMVKANIGYFSSDIIFSGDPAARNDIFHISIENKIIERGYITRTQMIQFDLKHDGHAFLYHISVDEGNRRFNLKVDIKRDPGKSIDGIIEFDLLGPIKGTLHVARNDANNQLDGKLTFEGRQIMSTKKFKHTMLITGKHIIGSHLDVKINTGNKLEELSYEGKFKSRKLSGMLKYTNPDGSKKKLNWSIDRGNNGMKAIWDQVKVKLVGFAGIVIKREITDVWNRKTTIVCRGDTFGLQYLGGKLTLQIQELNADKKRVSIIVDTWRQKEILKYINTISINTLGHDGHQNLAITTKANFDQKQTWMIPMKSIIKCPFPSSIFCSTHGVAEVTLNYNLEKRKLMYLEARINTDGSFKYWQSTVQCGVEGNKNCGEIIGGSVTCPNQYPWMVRLPMGCGGALITDKHVLTAKHCLDDNTNWRGRKIKVSVHDQFDPRDYQEVSIKNYVWPNTNDNDIAIIILGTSVNLNDKTIGTVCLPSSASEDYRGESATAVGWGMTHVGFPQSRLLQHLSLTVTQRQQKNWLYTDVQVVNGVPLDPCGGDSGGPLVHQDRSSGRWTIIGTVKGQGFDCRTGKTNGDGKWNKVTDHLAWIKSVIG